MKKYKLIKTYPGSPKLGTINTYTPIFCDNYPEFWEEVIEKDYEILSFISNKKHGNPGFIVGIKNNMSVMGNHNIKEYIEDIDDWWNIYSVKRLSDGEVFTVGDRINHYGEYAKNEFSTKTYTLKKIYFIEENTLTFYVGKGFNLGAISASKYKLPLFTTEDGIQIFKGDECWAINKTDLDYLGKVDFRNNHPYDYALYFSNEKKLNNILKKTNHYLQQKMELIFLKVIYIMLLLKKITKC